MVQVDYTYLTASALAGADSEAARLELSTSGGPTPHPYFYSGFVERPRLLAGLLLSVSHIATARYHVPAAMRDAAIRSADPVVTSDGARLRFESFSACGSVYSRADLFEEVLGGGFAGRGTTNVDMNPPMRNALAVVRDDSLTHLRVGDEELAVATPARTVVERKVRLPERWVRGFGEVQVAQSRMSLAHDLPRAASRRFLSSLAAARTTGDWWALPAPGGTLAISRRPGEDAVALVAIERVRVLTAHAGGVERLRVFTGAGPEDPVAWVLDFRGARLSLVISPDPRRGFSGEGGVLEVLTDAAAATDAETVTRMLEVHEGVSTIDALTGGTGLPAHRARRAAGVVSATGRAGYDLAEEGWFARTLPYSIADLSRLHPRLGGAADLGSNAVRILSDVDGKVVARVKGRHGAYVVRDDGDLASCTCPWYTEHDGRGGPCKHVLAVRLARR